MQLIRKVHDRLITHPVPATTIVIVPIDDGDDEHEKLEMRKNISELDSRLRYIEQRMKISERQ